MEIIQHFLQRLPLPPPAQIVEIFREFGLTGGLIVSALFLFGGIIVIAQIMARARSKRIVSQAEVEKIKAEAERDEQKTNAALNGQITALALQLTQERSESNRQTFELMNQLADYRAKNAEVMGEYSAYKLNQSTIVEGLKSQLHITEQAWHQTRDANIRLQTQLDELTQRVKGLQDQTDNLQASLNAANIISEQRKQENDQLRHLNAGLEEENAGLLQRIELMDAEIKELRQENDDLKRRVAELEREAQQRFESEPAGSPPVLVPEHEGA